LLLLLPPLPAQLCHPYSGIRKFVSIEIYIFFVLFPPYFSIPFKNQWATIDAAGRPMACDVTVPSSLADWLAATTNRTGRWVIHRCGVSPLPPSFPFPLLFPPLPIATRSFELPAARFMMITYAIKA